MRPILVFFSCAALVLGACSTAPDAGEVRNPPAITAAADAPAYVQLLAVGDIASCAVDADEKVAQVAKERPGKLALLGDIVYENGTATEFANCFDPAWGSMAARFRPSLGNHDIRTNDGGPYFNYFGDYAGSRGKGWYAFNVGAHWRAIVLNTNCGMVNCAADSAQGRFLANAIANAGDRHILGFWHHPLYSSGHHGPNPSVRPLFRMLYRGGAKLVLNGHDHNYERFAPQNAQGDRRADGIQQFVVGTGGASLRGFDRIMANSVKRNASSSGLLQLRLKPAGYSWLFVPAVGGFTDSGSRALN